MLKVAEKPTRVGYIYRDAIVNKLNAAYESHSSLIAVNLNKVNTRDLIQLRKSLNDKASTLLITKLSLFKRFLKGIKKEKLLDESCTCAGLVFVGDDIVATTKALAEFVKEHTEFKLLAGILDDKDISSAELADIAKLPGRVGLIAKGVIAMKFPLIKFRAVLEQLTRKLLLCLISAKEQKQVKDKKVEVQDKKEDRQ
ncbi:MAG: 50S ribosomal protein L10 [Candidatus Omnitrophica bacterium]|nr:50S ribosomal protein L10 [Candidatus Omnitrophota bacterium]